MTQSHWYIASAREAFEMGHRIIASKLNAVLAKNAPGLAIQADPPRLGDSMKEAIARFRRALPGLQMLREMPERVSPWTLGFINGDNNVPWNISLFHDWEMTDPFIFDFLSKKCPNRRREDWRRWIVIPVDTQMTEILQEFADLERLAISVPSAAADKPKKYVIGWAEIASVLEEANDNAFQKRVKKLQEAYSGPIIFAGRGSPPKVERSKLLDWWNSLEDRFRDAEVRRINRQESVGETHNYGREATVVPEIKGTLKKRRALLSGKVRKSSE